MHTQPCIHNHAYTTMHTQPCIHNHAYTTFSQEFMKAQSAIHFAFYKSKGTRSTVHPGSLRAHMGGWKKQCLYIRNCAEFYSPACSNDGAPG